MLWGRGLLRRFLHFLMLPGNGELGGLVQGFVLSAGEGTGDGLHDGHIVDGAPLHIVDQRLAHLTGVLPTVGGVRRTGLLQNSRHFLVGRGGSGQGLGGVLGQGAVVENLVENHAQGISIRGAVQNGQIVQQFRRGVAAAIFFRHGGKLHGIQGYKAQIPDFVFLFGGNKNIGWLQVDIHHPGLPAGAEGGAQVDAQIHRLQMADGVPMHIPLQREPEAAEQIQLVADAVFPHGLHLAALKGHKALQPG